MSDRGPQLASDDAPEVRRERPAPRKPRLQHEGTASSPWRGRLVVAAGVVGLVAGGWWLLGRGHATVAADATPSAVIARDESPTPLSAPARATPAAPVAPDDAAAGGEAPAAVEPVALEPITSSPVPRARPEPPPRETPAPPPAPVAPRPLALPVISTDLVAGSIDSVTKARVDASLRPKVVQPTFGPKPASPPR